MAGDEDIEKLLREIDAMNAGGQVPAPQPNRAITGSGETGVAAAGSGKATPAGRSARMTWTGVSTLGGLAAGGFVGTVLAFLPAMSTVSTAVGAAMGAAAAGFVSGPPDWFSRRR